MRPGAYASAVQAKPERVRGGAKRLDPLRDRHARCQPGAPVGAALALSPPGALDEGVAITIEELTCVEALEGGENLELPDVVAGQLATENLAQVIERHGAPRSATSTSAASRPRIVDVIQW